MNEGIRIFRRSSALGYFLVALMIFALTAEVQGSDKRYFFRIRENTLGAALDAFARKTKVLVLYPYELAGTTGMNPVIGRHTVREAYQALLRGTKFSGGLTENGVLTITVLPSKKIDLMEEDVNKTQRRAALLGGIAGIVATIGNGAIAQDDATDHGPIEEIVSVGTRSKGRTAIATPVPVDVVSNRAITGTGHTEVGRALQTLAPSFNFSSSSVSDGTDALRPATLRGLGPDQTLVLVNGKRRHSSALVNVNTSVGRGSVGTDLNAIPGAAFSRIEVLRDGAAAQYGSDAIAGVINLVLNQSSEGGAASVYYGQTYEGDGGVFVANGNMGFELGDGGFINFTAEYRDRGNTNRAGLFGERIFADLEDGSIDPREVDAERQNFRIGDADNEQYAFVVNAELPINDNANFYFFGTYSDRQNQSAGFFRSVRRGPAVPELYPDGFLPLINTSIEDVSLTGGIEWAFDSGWDLDLSINHGSNSFAFNISNSFNPLFGALSATSADAGTLGYSQTTFNSDMVKTFDLGDAETTFAFGAEYRAENYTIEAGEPLSFAGTGISVFRGFDGNNERDADRNNVSFYVDVESQVNDRWLVAAAARYEDYSDFGSTLTGKFSTRFEITDDFAFRGSIATGFRAPSLQQANFNSVSTQFVEVNGETVQQERGTFSNDSALAQAVGVPELKEETSLSFSAGFVATLDALTLTVDFYRIEIEDRIAISAGIPLDLFENTGPATSAQFFLNAADTTTNGVDFVATYDVDLGGDQSWRLSAAANFTDTDIDRDSIVSAIGGVDVGPLFTPQDIAIVESFQPKSRINFSSNYTTGNWNIIARLSQFGSYTVCEGSCDSTSNVQDFGAKWLTDLQVKYTFEDSGLALAVGVNNLFDVTPDLNLIGQSRAGTIPGVVDSIGVFQFNRRSAPFGFNGGLWYARMSYEF
ncbi:MAG: ligand-gated channel protein [Kordiimonadales bacterium]|nr:MAG: ligand-gated channel protein [Kordiimonadales bacterium]